MTRDTNPGFDSRIADWLEADPSSAPPDLIRTVEGALPSVPQRRVLRLPFRSVTMNRTLLILAAALLLAAVGAGAWSVGSQRTSVAPAPSVAPVAPAPSTATTDTYAAARDAVCDAGMAERAPLEARYLKLWKSGATDAERADAVAALRDFVALDRRVAADLLALDPPPALLRDHVANVAHIEDVITLITYELTLIDDGKLVDAQAVDVATDPISRVINQFELQHRLHDCP